MGNEGNKRHLWLMDTCQCRGGRAARGPARGLLGKRPNENKQEEGNKSVIIENKEKRREE